jgi:hypothetical protein
VVGKHELGDFLPRKVGLKRRLGVQLKFTFQFAANHKAEDSKYNDDKDDHVYFVLTGCNYEFKKLKVFSKREFLA